MVTQRQEEKIVFSQGKESLLVASVNGKKKMRELKGKPRYAEKLDHARGFPGVQEAMASSEELLRELDPWCSSQRLKEAWPVGAFISTS